MIICLVFGWLNLFLYSVGNSIRDLILSLNLVYTTIGLKAI